jgi:hypothetical protein
LGSVADTHHFDANPDPACHFDADPDPTCYFDDPTFHFDSDPRMLDSDPNADFDPSFQIKAQQLEKVLK